MMINLYYRQIYRLGSGYKDKPKLIFLHKTKNGSHIEPCGTPQLIGCHVNDMPQTSTRYFLSLRYGLNQMERGPPIKKVLLFVYSLI